MNKYRIAVCISVIAWILAVGSGQKAYAQNQNVTMDILRSEEVDLPVIHPQFRAWPTPSAGMVAPYNPPMLLWPVTRKEGTIYEVRLARDPSFRDGVLESKTLPYAIYNPYQELEEGEWYWQYRVNDGMWSDLQRFRIGPESVRWNLPSLQMLKEQIPAKHPRVLVKKGMTMDAFRTKLTAAEDVNHVIRQGNMALQRTIPDEQIELKNPDEDDPDRLEKLRKDAAKNLGDAALDVVKALSQAYVVTGEQKYADRAIEWAMVVSSWDPDGVTSVSDFGDSRCMLSMALTYDTFHDQLSEPKKKALLTGIEARASRFYSGWINHIEAKVLSNHVWQHVYHYFFQTTLATYRDIPAAEHWLEYLYELFIARAPALGPNDGGWVNGNKYFTMNMEVLLDVPLTIRDWTGFDFMKHKKWYQNNPYYLWYSLPPHSASDGFGDNARGFAHPSVTFMAYADALGKLTGNSDAIRYAELARKGTDFQISDDKTLRWIRLKYLTDFDEAGDAELVELPRSRVFEDAGLVYLNRDVSRTPDNLMVAMRSSPFGSYGHMLADQNTFNILYGGKPVFYHSGHKISMNDPHRQKWYKHTKSHNGILIDGEGQPYSTETYGWIPYFLEGKGLSYAMGDASQAYHSVKHGGKADYGLDKFHRHLLLLDSSILVVYDELEADHPAKWSWVLHSPLDEISRLEGDAFSFSSEEMTSRVDVMSSGELEWEVTDKYETPAENWRGEKDEEGTFVDLEDDDWHLKGTSTPQKSMRILALFQVGREDSRLFSVARHDQHIEVGDWVIKPEWDTTKPGRLVVRKRDNSTVFSTGDQSVELAGEVFNPPANSGAILVETLDGKFAVEQAPLRVPDGIREAWNALKQEKVSSTE